MTEYKEEVKKMQLKLVSLNKECKESPLETDVYHIERRLAEIFKPLEEIHNLHKLKLPENRPKIVCLCGSSRFVAEMAELAWNFEKLGHIALGLHLLPQGYTDVKDHLAESEGVADKMDELHLRKIDLADWIFIVNKDGYIGESTAREIEYAKSQSKPIKYLEQVKELNKDLEETND